MPKSKLPNKDFLWNADLAYAIGLIATDGNLSKNGRTIILRSCDREQVEQFRACVGATNRVESPMCKTQYGHRICYRIQVGNVQLYRWLLKIGLFPAKTYTIGALDIPDVYFRDFLRGHLDGDGNVTTYTDRYNTFKNPKYAYVRLWVEFCSTSETHIKWIQTRIKSLLGISGHLSQAKISYPNQTVGVWYLKFGKADSLKLFHWMYYDPLIPHLARKRRKFEEAIIASQPTESHPRSGRPRVSVDPLESFPCTTLNLQFCN